MHSLSLSTQAMLLPVSGNPEIKIFLDIKERVVWYSKSSTIRNPNTGHVQYLNGQSLPDFKWSDISFWTEWQPSFYYLIIGFPKISLFEWFFYLNVSVI